MNVENKKQTSTYIHNTYNIKKDMIIHTRVYMFLIAFIYIYTIHDVYTCAYICIYYVNVSTFRLLARVTVACCTLSFPQAGKGLQKTRLDNKNSHPCSYFSVPTLVLIFSCSSWFLSITLVVIFSR